MIDPSILRAMLAAGATAEMIVVAVEAACALESDRRANRAEYMRNYRKSYVKSRDITTPPLSPPMINNSTPPIPTPKTIKPLPEEPLFEQFWEVFPRKVGKGAARKAYRHALTRASHLEILAGAKRYRPDAQFTKHPTTWLNADCWLDEPEKTKANVVQMTGRLKVFEPEPPKPNLTPEQKSELDAKLARVKARLTNG